MTSGTKKPKAWKLHSGVLFSSYLPNLHFLIKVLDECYILLNHGQTLPSYEDLHDILRQLLRELGQTYIILDALDKCDDNEFVPLVDLVSALREWAETPLHILFTSQPHQIFTQGFEGITCIALEFHIMEGDIRHIIAGEIQTNPKLKIYRHRADDITDHVVRKSNGMFRLATSLPVELTHCKWEDKKLENLLDSLFGIYDCFFDTISADDLVYVNAILRWIMFKLAHCIDGSMPLEVLADAISFDFPVVEEYVYMPKQREANANIILSWLEGLVINPTIGGKPRVILAHASVQDTHFTTKFKCDLRKGHSHTFLAGTCISYFLYFSHHRLDDDPSSRHSIWLEGYIEGVEGLLALNVDINLVVPFAWTALTGALIFGHTHIVHLLLQSGANIVWLLLENGANVNLQDGKHVSALAAALDVCETKTAIAHLLLENGANGNIPGGEYGSALGTTSYRGETKIVRLLLENGADVNLPGGEYGSALGTASWAGRTEIVCLLLENGANVNLPGGQYCSSLGAASYRGKTRAEIVHLLLKNGADVNLQGGVLGSALGLASWAGGTEILCLLLENGADVNLTGGKYGSALGAASCAGNFESVCLLLRNGANINIAGGEYGNALTVASVRGHTNIVKLLLKNGANVNAAGGDHGSALQAASNAGDC
ncbi:ankyrin repeat-containing domain protein [Mycena maculata]|uniref:Ankyrin repeat-containing domain protein n=1 Tax=Mycena maculata TaxID=230809 RepID=A0AAD7NGX5_9AGAR|nr:ankyrin repeat-containing domain protein [Mycena maculata]